MPAGPEARRPGEHLPAREEGIQWAPTVAAVAALVGILLVLVGGGVVRWQLPRDESRTHRAVYGLGSATLERLSGSEVVESRTVKYRDAQPRSGESRRPGRRADGSGNDRLRQLGNAGSMLRGMLILAAILSAVSFWPVRSRSLHRPALVLAASALVLIGLQVFEGLLLDSETLRAPPRYTIHVLVATVLFASAGLVALGRVVLTWSRRCLTERIWGTVFVPRVGALLFVMSVVGVALQHGICEARLAAPAPDRPRSKIAFSFLAYVGIQEGGDGSFRIGYGDLLEYYEEDAPDRIDDSGLRELQLLRVVGVVSFLAVLAAVGLAVPALFNLGSRRMRVLTLLGGVLQVALLILLFRFLLTRSTVGRGLPGDYSPRLAIGTLAALGVWLLVGGAVLLGPLVGAPKNHGRSRGVPE